MRAPLSLAVLSLGAFLAACNAAPAQSQSSVKVDGKTAAEWEAEADKALAASQTAAPAPTLAQAAPTAAPVAAKAGAIPAGHYQCTIYVGYLQNSPGFTINGNGTYTHEQGSTGKVSMDNTGLVLFTGGALDGQAAKYERDGGGRPVIRLYNESRSRTDIDCQM